jgi:cobalamin synthase
VAVLLLVTGARPLIGLMVLAGALFSGRNAEGVARLACRRTPAPSGLLVGIGAVLLKYALLLALSGHQRLPALILAAALGRTAVVWICWRFRYAGLDTGIAEWLTSLASPRDLALCLPVLALSFGLLGPLVTPAAVMGTWLLAHGFSYWVSKVLGGLMAHNLDAAAELGELGALGAMIALTHVQGLA